MLYVRGVPWIVEQRIPNMKRCGSHFRYNLLSFDVVCNIPLTYTALEKGIFKNTSCIPSHHQPTLSLAPRFKNLAPAKYRDLRAIRVTNIFLPRTEISISILLVNIYKVQSQTGKRHSLA